MLDEGDLKSEPRGVMLSDAGTLSNQHSQSTDFQIQLQKLYDNILMLYPSFGVDTAEAATPDGRIILPPGTNADSQIFAIQLYN